MAGTIRPGPGGRMYGDKEPVEIVCWVLCCAIVVLSVIELIAALLGR
jgi:hypothetical protein